MSRPAEGASSSANSALVIGAGVSGIAAAKFLRSKACRVRLSDVKAQSEDRNAELAAAAIEVRIGPQDQSLLSDGIDLIVLSSGVRDDLPICLAARELGIPIVSETDLAFAFHKLPVIAVTGTNGKSTVTKMVSHLLETIGVQAPPSGNYGTPMCEILKDAVKGARADAFSLELSSYQLANSHAIRAEEAIFVNFANDHEKWHGSTAAYFRAKWRIIDSLSPRSNDRAEQAFTTSLEVLRLAAAFDLRVPKHLPVRIVLNGLSADPTEAKALAPDASLYFMMDDGLHDEKGRCILPWSELAVKEQHNRLNASLAFLATRAFAERCFQKDLPASAFRGYEPLAYRYAHLFTKSGYHLINDSKATNVDAVLAALNSSPSSLILMLGGQSKGESFGAISEFSDKIKELICFGASGRSIAQDLDAKLNKISIFPTLTEALARFPDYAPGAGEVLLFSPGCASFDEFKNYEDRGLFFDETMKMR